MKILGRHGLLWFIGRLGILLCLGIIPLMQMPERIRQHKELERREQELTKLTLLLKSQEDHMAKLYQARDQFYAHLSSNDFSGGDPYMKAMVSESSEVSRIADEIKGH